MIWPSAVTLLNGHVVTPHGAARSLRFARRVLEVDGPPHRGDAVIDLDGAFVLPGLINAHDHLELNHFGRRKYRDNYANASEWVADMRPRLHADPDIRARRSVDLGSRLLVGVLKNLAAGVTTVAHHNPLYRELSSRLPIRLVRRFGWAHSYLLEHGPVGAHGERGGVVRDRYRQTPRGVPFFVHIAEGTDPAAAAELTRLDADRALHPNTVVIHGTGMSEEDWPLVVSRRASLVWCPASNLFLFGRTPPIARWLAAPGAYNRIALGTDSRLTGSRDLLDEMRCARRSGVDADDVLHMVTRAAADIVAMPQIGHLAPGATADLIIVPRLRDRPADAVLAATRGDLGLVVVGGRPRFGRAAMVAAFAARRVAVGPIVMDGECRIASASLVRLIARARLAERGMLW